MTDASQSSVGSLSGTDKLEAAATLNQPNIDPFADEPDKKPNAEWAKDQTLKQRAIAWCRKNPDLCVLALILFLNIVVLGHVTGNGIEPSRMFSKLRWLKAHPFAEFYNRIDAVVFAFTTAQVSLVTLWACFSGRNILTRIGTWSLVTATLTLVLLATINAGYHAGQLIASFVSLSLGITLGSIWLRAQGWQTSWRSVNLNNRPDRRLSSRELMIVSGIVGLLCVVVACISQSSYSYGWTRLWNSFFNWNSLGNYAALGILGIASGSICLLVGTSGENNRSKLVILSFAKVCICFGVYFGIHYFRYMADGIYLGTVNMIEMGERLGATAVWALLHILGQVVVLCTFSAAGIRVSRVDPSNKSNAMIWLSRAMVALFIIGLAVGGYVLSQSASSLRQLKRLHDASSIAANSGGVRREPSTINGGYTLGLYNGLTQAQVTELNQYPEIEQVLIYQPEASDTQTELDALLNLIHVRDFQWVRAPLSDEQIEILTKKRPDATFR